MTERDQQILRTTAMLILAAMGVLTMIYGSGFDNFIGSFMAMTAISGLFRG